MTEFIKEWIAITAILYIVWLRFSVVSLKRQIEELKSEIERLKRFQGLL
jgi:hypothetical protein